MLELADHQRRLNTMGAREDQPDHDVDFPEKPTSKVVLTKWRLSRISLAQNELDDVPQSPMANRR